MSDTDFSLWSGTIRAIDPSPAPPPRPKSKRAFGLPDDAVIVWPYRALSVGAWGPEVVVSLVMADKPEPFCATSLPCALTPAAAREMAARLIASADKAEGV